MSAAVLSSIGKKMVPSTERRARHLLKKKRAVIYRYRPIFTIRLTGREDGDTQPIEDASDVGKMHAGISIKSEKHKYACATYNMLPDEKKRYDDCREFCRTRRNRLRYRKARFNSRSKQNKQHAPLIRYIEENQLNLFNVYWEVIPVTTAAFEMGQFDTQALEVIEAGKPLPHGYRHKMKTLRKAVFARDNCACQCCGKFIGDGVTLCAHHLGFRKHDHPGRLGKPIALCTKCHTAKNHRPGDIVAWSDMVNAAQDTHCGEAEYCWIQANQKKSLICDQLEK